MTNSLLLNLLITALLTGLLFYTGKRQEEAEQSGNRSKWFWRCAGAVPMALLIFQPTGWIASLLGLESDDIISWIYLLVVIVLSTLSSTHKLSLKDATLSSFYNLAWSLALGIGLTVGVIMWAHSDVMDSALLIAAMVILLLCGVVGAFSLYQMHLIEDKTGSDSY